MGAHTLGSMLKENSGFGGVWVVGGSRVFDNKYYSLMIDSSVTWTNIVRDQLFAVT